MTINTLLYFFVYHKSNFSQYNSEQLYNLVSSQKLSADCSIWSSIQGTWLPLEEWKKDFFPLLQDFVVFQLQKWQVKIENLEIDNLSFDEVINTIVDANLEKVEIRIDRENESYLPITNYKVFTSLVFFSKRKKKRYPLSGWVKTPKPGKNYPLMGKIRDIGIDGIGILIQECHLFKRGDTVPLSITTNELPRSFSAVGRVAHISKKDSFLGLEFVDIYDEGLQMLNDFFFSLE